MLYLSDTSTVVLTRDCCGPSHVYNIKVPVQTSLPVEFRTGDRTDGPGGRGAVGRCSGAELRGLRQVSRRMHCCIALARLKAWPKQSTARTNPCLLQWAASASIGVWSSTGRACRCSRRQT